jgi:cyclic-di-AMP phosphodiesterase PgpH
MNKFLIYVSNKHSEILKFFLVLTSIFLIVFMLPMEAKFKYEFQKGKPWLHETLIAPFDFAINKTKEEVAKEKAALLMSLHPYYRMDGKIAEKKLNEFAASFDLKWNLLKNSSGPPGEKQKQRKIGSDILRTIYNKGIVLLGDESEGKPSDYVIMVIKNNVSEEAELGNFYTVQSAFEYMESALKKNQKAERDFLLPLLENTISHNIFYDDSSTSRVYKEQFDNISLTHGMVQTGERIILRGDVVDNQKFQILESMKTEYENKLGSISSNYSIRAGYFLLVIISLTVLLVFLALFRKDIFADNLRVTLLLLLIVMMVFIYTWTLKSGFFNLYLVPFCIIPIIIRAFYDTRLALFTHIVIILIVGFMAPNGFEFVFLQIIAGMVAIFSIVSMRNRSQLFMSVGFILMAYFASYTCISIIHEGNISTIDWDNLRWFAGNALLTLFAYPLIYIFEKIFGFISDVSLMEMSDLNSPLLKELAFKAPGTFQHSMQVANLAEAAIYEIGGNTLLIRAGALYHDIGKMDIPVYYIENQSSAINPHDELSFEESARIIIGHVIKGVEKAKKQKLPEQIVDFIRTHHGTTMVQYFYQSFLKNYPDKLVNENTFRYPGPIPFSKETAVLMMADSVEASSRSLKKIDEEAIDKLVENIIDNQIRQNQFANSDITFKDIKTIKKIFKKMLMSVYHVRVDYSPA